MDIQKIVTITYTNWKSEVVVRTIIPGGLRHGSEQWHSEPQGLLRVLDVEKSEERNFAMKDISQWSS